MRKFAAALAASFICLSACGTSNAPLITEHITNVPTAEKGHVAEAIRSSLRYLQWEILEEGDGFFIAKSRHKNFSVTSRVAYSDFSYSIDYVDSEGLEDSSLNRIWNRWVRTLDRDIRIGLNLPQIPN